MKNKFIRVISPLSLIVVLALDGAALFYAVVAVKKIIEFASAINIFFAVCEAFAIIIAILTTREVTKHGVIFRDDSLEFTGIDDNNTFRYESITKVEAQKDEAASFVKNFLDRQAKIILTLQDESVVTIDIGLIQKSTLKKIANEICIRANLEPVEIITSPKKNEHPKVNDAKNSNETETSSEIKN